jgi:hypothetical protein
MFGLALPPGLLVGGLSSTLAVALGRGITISVGVVGIIATFATILGVIYGVRWKIAYEVECKAREGGEALNAALEERIRTLAHERDEFGVKCEELDRTLREAQKTIARLEALPNLERVLELVNGGLERMRDRLDAMHRENIDASKERDEAAEERTARLINEIRRREA